MSHFTRVATTPRDRDLPAAALRSVGRSSAGVHDNPQPLRGWGAQCRAVPLSRHPS